jgi:hypothetical protein
MPRNRAETQFLERLLGGLDKKSIVKCSEWTERYRVMGKPIPGPWRFKHHPWLREMHDCKDEFIVGQKSAQMGYSETALNRALFANDVRGASVLYILPTMSPDAKNFSAARFDPALEMSPYLAKLYSDIKNVGHKRAGNASLYVRGSRKRSHLKSVPAGDVIIDEMDEMDESNIALALERPAGQIDKSILMLSTPGVAKHGINHYFQNSSQDHFYFPCPHCGRHIELTFPECLIVVGEDPHDKRVMDSHLICPECKHTLEHEAKMEFLAKGYWKQTVANKLARGFYINQLYSCMEPPWKLAQKWLLAQTSIPDEVEFYNSKMGVVHETKGARITDSDYLSCIGSHKDGCQSRGNGRLVTMGVDVGSKLHVEIDEWTVGADMPCKVLHANTYKDFEELDLLMREYQVNFAVCDANPERRKALEFCKRFNGYARACFYTVGNNGKNIHLYSDEELTVGVDRTSWLDKSLGRFRNGTIKIPLNMPLQYKAQIQAQVKTYKKDQNGNPIARYVHGKGEDDHYGHARNYAEIAYAVLTGELTPSEDIKEDVL